MPEKSAKIHSSTKRTQKVSTTRKQKKEKNKKKHTYSGKKPTYVKILLDSGASASIVHKSYVQKNNYESHKISENVWNTMAGSFTTSYESTINITLPELNPTAHISAKLFVTENKSNYDLIFGRDLLRELGISLDFENNLVSWQHVEIPMKPRDCTVEGHFAIEESTNVQQATTRIKKILDAKYEKANLKEIVKSLNYLTKSEQKSMLQLLRKYESMFDGTLGDYTGSEYKIELQDNIKPYHAKPFPIPRVHEETLKKEVNRLVEIGVLKRVNNSEWAAPTFIIPKKNKTVRFISDFRELNKRIKRKPFPIPKIQDLLLKLEGFKYATSLDLNMGYYHIKLCPFSRKLCTIVLPWGKYEYQKLPMGLCNSPDIFQEKMNDLFAGLDYVRAYIDFFGKFAYIILIRAQIVIHAH